MTDENQRRTPAIYDFDEIRKHIPKKTFGVEEEDSLDLYRRKIDTNKTFHDARVSDFWKDMSAALKCRRKYCFYNISHVCLKSGKCSIDPRI